MSPRSAVTRVIETATRGLVGQWYFTKDRTTDEGPSGSPVKARTSSRAPGILTLCSSSPLFPGNDDRLGIRVEPLDFQANLLHALYRPGGPHDLLPHLSRREGGNGAEYVDFSAVRLDSQIERASLACLRQC